MESQKDLQEKLTSIKSIPKGVAGVITQRDAVKQNIRYVKKRASGEIKPLATCFNNLNKILSGGFEANTILTLSGLSGGGKSTLSKKIMNSITKDILNSGRKCVSLSFNFEMLAHKTIGREIANLKKLSLKELYSSEHPLASAAMSDLIKNVYSEIVEYPIIYVEEPQDHTVIGNTIYFYWDKLCRKDNSVMIVEVDHAVITKGKTGETQKDKVDNLMETLNAVKKKISAAGGEVFFIVLSQMNRDIKRSDRLTDPTQHYPMTSDLFGASSIEFFSDYILITHMPAKLHLKSYTDYNFPIYLEENDDRYTDFIYWHLLKNRDGEPDKMIPMLNNLKYFDFEEIPENDFKVYCSEFRKTGSCVRV